MRCLTLDRPSGEVASWTWGNGAAYTRSYDLDGRLTSLSMGPGTRTTAYDLADKLTSLSDFYTTKSYSHDVFDRVTYSSSGGFNRYYDYDQNGNRTRYGENAGSWPYAYAPDSNRLLGIAGPVSRSYSYDAAGNLTGNGYHGFTYNNRGRLSASSSVAAGTVTYLYNLLGQRVAKKTATTTMFVYDEGGVHLHAAAARRPDPTAGHHRLRGAVAQRSADRGHDADCHPLHPRRSPQHPAGDRRYRQPHALVLEQRSLRLTAAR